MNLKNPEEIKKGLTAWVSGTYEQEEDEEQWNASQGRNTSSV